MSRIGRRATFIGLLGLAVGPGLSATAYAASPLIELRRLDVTRDESALVLDFETRFDLPPGVEDALQRGVALHFLAEANLWRTRWYWRDKRITGISRSWRLTYQPLTFSYRVSLGGLSQTYPTLSDAMRSLQRMGRWRVADGADADEVEYIEFSYRLDVDQLPRPLLIAIGSQPEWSLRVERTIRLPAVVR